MGAVVFRLILRAPLAALEEPTLGHQTTTGKWMKGKKEDATERFRSQWRWEKTKKMKGQLQGKKIISGQRRKLKRGKKGRKYKQITMEKKLYV